MADEPSDAGTSWNREPLADLAGSLTILGPTGAPVARSHRASVAVADPSASRAELSGVNAGWPNVDPSGGRGNETGRGSVPVRSNSSRVDLPARPVRCVASQRPSGEMAARTSTE